MSERDSVSTGYLYFDVDLVFGAASSQRNRVKGDSFSCAGNTWSCGGLCPGSMRKEQEVKGLRESALSPRAKHELEVTRASKSLTTALGSLFLPRMAGPSANR